jgi:hypothetical protein
MTRDDVKTTMGLMYILRNSPLMALVPRMLPPRLPPKPPQRSRRVLLSLPPQPPPASLSRAPAVS